MKKKSKDPEQIRSSVSKDYAAAVRNPGKSCCGQAEPKGVTAKLAGYSKEELAVLPNEAVVNSFGCGNPMAFSDVNQGEVVVDLGCGAGIDLLIAARKVGSTGKVIGIDMTDEMIAKAKQNIKVSGLKNIEVRKGIIEELPVEDASVDWIISNCVINLSPEKERVFKEIHRVLKPGGKMSVSDIMAEELPKEVLESPSLYSSCLSGAISEKMYIEGLRKAGLKDIEVRERLAYDEAQLSALIGSETEGGCGAGCCSGTSDGEPHPWAKMLKGKIASLKIFARK